MIIINELPFWFVEGEGFKSYSKDLEPRFDIHSRHMVVNDVFKIYDLDKDLLKKIYERVKEFVLPLIDGHQSKILTICV